MSKKNAAKKLCGSTATKSGKPCKQKKPCRFKSHQKQDAKPELCGSTATSSGKPCKQKKPCRFKKHQDPEPESELWTQSKLAEFFALDRATIRTRLEAAGVQPKNNNKRNYQYDFNEARIAIERAGNAELKSLKLEKEAKLLDVKLKKETGQFASVAQFTELTHEWVSSLHKKLVMQLPGRVIKKLARSESEAEAKKILKDAIQAVFDEFRDNPHEYLNESD